MTLRNSKKLCSHRSSYATCATASTASTASPAFALRFKSAAAAAALLVPLFLCSGNASAEPLFKAASDTPISIIAQGSFAAGGSVVTPQKDAPAYDPYKPSATSQTLHGDHAYVTYQIPADAKPVSLVFLHGAGQFSKTWDTTPDGRDGFRNIFLRKHFPVYLMDQPRRGAAGRASVAGKIDAAPDEGFWFGQFRMGLWPNFYEGTQFPTDEASLNQFYRQMTPNTAPYSAEVASDAVVETLKEAGKKSGTAVLVTHSQGGGIGWLAGIKAPDNAIRAIVSYEPGSGFPFPEGEVPAPIENSSFFGAFKANAVPLEKFLKLTKYPIVIYYGDYIPRVRTDNPHTDYWRAAAEMADHWAAAVNRHGGNARVVRLPEAGLKGNTHFPFAEKNNAVVAELLETWLEKEVLK